MEEKQEYKGNENTQWATVELMGHAQTAGRIEMSGGLLRVDVPDGDTWRTEYYGMAAIYSIKLVSEEIARAFVRRTIDARPYDAPIITREEHRMALFEQENENAKLRQRLAILERRLTAVNDIQDEPEPAMLVRGFEDGDDE